MSNGGPPAGATQLTDNPSPPAFAPSTVPNQPPKGATQLKAAPTATDAEGPTGLRHKRGGGQSDENSLEFSARLSSQIAKQANPSGLLHTLEQVSMPMLAKHVYEVIKGNKQAFNPTADAMIGGVKGVYSSTTPGIAQRLMKHEDPASITATGVLGYLTAASTDILGEDMAAKPPVGVKDAARTLTDAVNPRPQHMPGFEADLAEHMPRIVDYAKRNGFEINSRASLAKALEGAGDEAYHDYYEQYIEPTKGEWVATTDIPGYQGETFGEGGHTATIQSLENRLSTINSTLYPKFQKGGLAAEASIDSGTAAQLSSEAAGIRNMMNQTIGQKLGIPPETVANARSKFGAPRDLADKTVRAINEERFGKNLERRGADVPSDRAGALRWAIRKITARNPDKAVANTMKRLKIERDPPPPSPDQQLAAHQQEMTARAKADAQRAAEQRQQQMQQGRQALLDRANALNAAAKKLGAKASIKEIMAEADKTSPPRTPIRGESSPGLGPEGSTPGERAAVSERLNQRREANAATREQEAAARSEAGEKRLQNERAHGTYKGTLPYD